MICVELLTSIPLYTDMGAQISRISHLRSSSDSGTNVKYDVLLFHEMQTPARGKLEITADDLIFREKSKPPISWPIRSIRRYGCEENSFEIESGRRCISGEGYFTFQSKYANRIFTVVQETVQRIAATDLAGRVATDSANHRSSPSHRSASRNGCNSPRTGGAAVNQYLNCDSQGRFNGGNPVAGFRGSADSLPSGVQYADLDLSHAGEPTVSSSGGPFTTPPRPKANFQRLHGGEDDDDVDDLPHLGVDQAASKRASVCSAGAVTYAVIDARKSQAAANLSRPRV
ncbi:hypothetical protein BV898_08136 [Hypsibius exemplaris]|uniref:IRS-type PTB domain-containing protein n=1 Tax=Hypsibius exemplaris TaxID=2072580 RepID=A0A1W0WRQ8_HYPEX|nr:hypothetical protein BV898_08136 [Hypsibius exemplaris]